MSDDKQPLDEMIQIYIKWLGIDPKVWSEPLARVLLALLPDAKAVAVDKHGDAYWFYEIPAKYSDCFDIYDATILEVTKYYLGQFECDNWKESLYVKQE
jgi:hypothetical protein